MKGIHLRGIVGCALFLAMAFTSTGFKAVHLATPATPSEANLSTEVDLDASLISAIFEGDITAARQALEAGADPNATHRQQLFLGSRTTPALVTAIEYKRREIVVLLLQAGADTNQGVKATALFSSELQHPFEFLVRTKDLEFIKDLITRIAPPPPAFAEGLLAASYFKEGQIFEFLLSQAKSYMRPSTNPEDPKKP